MKSEPPSNFKRVLVSLCVVLALFLGKALPLPGVSWSELPGESGTIERIAQFPMFSVGALGAKPLIEGFVIVEIFALLVPPWRKLRNGNARGRRKLFFASLAVALATVVAQGLAIAPRMQEGFPATTPGVLMAYVSWTLTLVALAQWAERSGALGGFPNLILAEASFSAATVFVKGELRTALPELLFQVGIACFALPVLTGERWRARGPVRQGDDALLFPWLVTGFVPLSFATAALTAPELVRRVVAPQSSSRAIDLLQSYPWWTTLVLLATAFVLAPAFYRRDDLRALSRSLSLGSETLLAERRTFSRARYLSLGYLALIWIATLTTSLRGVPFNLGTPFVLTALLLDGASMLRFRSAHKDAVSVYQSDRVYAAIRIAQALRAHGMAVHLAGLRHRSVLHFFGPYVPIGILVPSHDADEAVKVLEPIIRDGLPKSDAKDASESREASVSEQPRGVQAKNVIRTKSLLMPSLCILLGLGALAGAALAVPPGPQWESVLPGTIAVFETDDTRSPFDSNRLEDCQGVRIEKEWISSDKKSLAYAFSVDRNRLVRCLETIELPPNHALLFQRVHEVPSGDPDGELRQELVGWRTVFVHEQPVVSSTDLWGFTVEDGGALRVRFNDPKLLEEITARNVDRRVAFVVAGEVASNPTVTERIPGGEFTISPYPTRERFGPLLEKLRGTAQ